MHLFKDSRGRDWEVAIDPFEIKRVRSEHGLDLYKLIDDGCAPLGRLLEDPVQLVEVLHTLCRRQLEAKKVEPEDFARAFTGDVLQAAADAFMEELFDFFPRPEMRATLRRLASKGREMSNRFLETATQELDRINPDQVIEKLKGTLSPESLAEKLKSSSGSVPASSASTPAI